MESVFCIEWEEGRESRWAERTRGKVAEISGRGKTPLGKCLGADLDKLDLGLGPLSISKPTSVQTQHWSHRAACLQGSKWAWMLMSSSLRYP